MINTQISNYWKNRKGQKRSYFFLLNSRIWAPDGFVIYNLKTNIKCNKIADVSQSTVTIACNWTIKQHLRPGYTHVVHVLNLS